MNGYSDVSYQVRLSEHAALVASIERNAWKVERSERRSLPAAIGSAAAHAKSAVEGVVALLAAAVSAPRHATVPR